MHIDILKEEDLMNAFFSEIVSLFLPKEKEIIPEEKTVTEQMDEILVKIEAAKSRFNCQSDERLLEATIFELQSLESKYNYLCQIAKEEKTPA